MKPPTEKELLKIAKRLFNIGCKAAKHVDGGKLKFTFRETMAKPWNRAAWLALAKEFQRLKADDNLIKACLRFQASNADPEDWQRFDRAANHYRHTHK